MGIVANINEIKDAAKQYREASLDYNALAKDAALNGCFNAEQELREDAERKMLCARLLDGVADDMTNKVVGFSRLVLKNFG